MMRKGVVEKESKTTSVTLNFYFIKSFFLDEQSLGQLLKTFCSFKIFSNKKHVFTPDKNFLDLQNVLKIVLMIAQTRRKLLTK
jgi:hypothetical protein